MHSMPDADPGTQPGASPPSISDRMAAGASARIGVGPGGLVRRGAAVPLAIAGLLVAGTVALGAFGVLPGLPIGPAPAGLVEPTDEPEPTPKPAAKASTATAKPASPSQPAKQAPSAKPAATNDAAETAEPTAKPKATARPKATAEPTAKPAAKPTPRATAEPTAKPSPVVTALKLEGWTKSGGVKLRWTAYGGSGFDYYKVVRSTDSTVAWPAGAGDKVVAAIADPKQAHAWDGNLEPDTYWYRVVAVKASGGGYAVLARSNVVKVVVPKPAPAPEPTAMWLEAAVTADGVVLSWEACGGEGFRYYKVVRSATNPSPWYPLNAGSELIGVVESAGATTFLDAAVAAGQTWHYRVLSYGIAADGSKLLLGVTPALTVTIQQP